MGLPNLNQVALGNMLSQQLGATSQEDSILQFYSRFGQDNLLQERALSTVLIKPYYFRVEMVLSPNSEEVSKVIKLIRNTVRSSSHADIKYYIQSINIPDITSYSPVESVASEFGMTSNPGLFVKASQNNFTIQFLSTEFSLHEHAFYYWLSETTSNRWCYWHRPFTKADIYVHFFDSDSKKTLFSYCFANCFPSGIETLSPSHEPSTSITRGVDFTFDMMYVRPSTEYVQSRLSRAFDKYIGDEAGRMLTTGKNKKLPTIPGI
jgi:hypothetical protein